MAQGRSRAGSAALWGVVCGLVLAALLVVSRLALAGAALRGMLTPGRALLSSVVALAVVAALYFVAGVLAGCHARAIEAGLFAGMIAGLIVGVTVLWLFVLAALRVPPEIAGGPQRAGIMSLARIAIARSGLDILVQMAVGAGLGGLGGLVGRGRGGRGAQQAGPPTSAPPAPPYPPYTSPPGASSPPPSPVYPASGDSTPTIPSQP
ncbi:MAG TPA: hypothetical protein VFU88_15605 [Ktedonobacterales bacterium]|nr:hypothetical protein [Ktedonobacterales bacterium]